MKSDWIFKFKLQSTVQIVLITAGKNRKRILWNINWLTGHEGHRTHRFIYYESLWKQGLGRRHILWKHIDESEGSEIPSRGDDYFYSYFIKHSCEALVAKYAITWFFQDDDTFLIYLYTLNHPF